MTFPVQPPKPPVILLSMPKCQRHPDVDCGRGAGHPGGCLDLRLENLALGRRLLDQAFTAPWRYRQFQIDCSVCSEQQGECSNPECDGDSVPCTFVEAPAAYPASEKRPQIVATIEVPGLSDLAEQNGEAICWLRNNGAQLIADSAELAQLKSALVWLMNSDKPGDITAVFEFAKSLGWEP